MPNIYSTLRRTVINEGDTFLLRRLLSEEHNPEYYDPNSGTLKLRNLCLRDIQAKDIKLTEPSDDMSFTEWLKFKKSKIEHDFRVNQSVYCRLFQLSQNLNSGLQDRLGRDISDIYDFLRQDLVRDNRRKFHTLLNTILEYNNPANSINLVAEYVRNTENSDEVRNTINTFKSSNVSESELENFLSRAKYSEYTKYEMSFTGEYFTRKSYSLRLKYRTETDDRHLIDRVFSILKGETKVSTVVGELYAGIRDNYEPLEMTKGDLICKKPLIDINGNVVVEKGHLVEVKKLDFQGDSYLSEFFAIYKRSGLSKAVHTPEFKSTYNQIIDGLFEILRTAGNDILQDIKDGLDGIIYSENTFISKDNITLYWSNKGRSSCLKDHRLSIRYRIDSETVDGYVLDGGKDALVPTPLTLDTTIPPVFCPISY